ncbi:MAG: hypothetical protein JO339_38100 [Alphaproteobacteria bacterium]|nr:hypothetical protein [Alphaproteobacteria bacterium]
MNVVSLTNRLARSPGDPKVLEIGPSSLLPGDRLARALGWFSLGLGMMELLAPRTVTRALGMEGREGLVRAYGAREIMAGIPTLSMDKQVGLASRVAGDVLDMATLLPALGARNPQRGNAFWALVAVAAVTALDVIAVSAAAGAHRRNVGRTMDYSDRSGLPKGIQASRGMRRSRSENTPQRAAA